MAKSSVGSGRKKVKKGDESGYKKKAKKFSARFRTKSKASTRSDRQHSRTENSCHEGASQNEKKKKEPWPAEEGVKKMVASGVFNADTLPDEFKTCESPRPGAVESEAFFANLTKNRAKEWPITNEKLVKLAENPGNFVSAARITSVTEFKRTLLVAQVPDVQDPRQLEDFWRMMFQEEVVCVLLAAHSAELNIQQFLPAAAGSFANHGKMFLNNKKIDSTLGAAATAYTIELLPDGCSNSINVTVYHVSSWKMSRAPDTYKELVAAMDKVLKTNENTVIMSFQGVGRAGTMLTTFAAMVHLTKDPSKDLRLKETLDKLRVDRAGLVENADQYVAVFKAIAWWTRQKTADESEVHKKLADFCPRA